jgi:hypothetical protein
MSDLLIKRDLFPGVGVAHPPADRLTSADDNDWSAKARITDIGPWTHHPQLSGAIRSFRHSRDRFCTKLHQIAVFLLAHHQSANWEPEALRDLTGPHASSRLTSRVRSSKSLDSIEASRVHGYSRSYMPLSFVLTQADGVIRRHTTVTEGYGRLRKVMEAYF